MRLGSDLEGFLQGRPLSSPVRYYHLKRVDLIIKTILTVIVVIVYSFSSNNLTMAQTSSGVVLFSDDFESYLVGQATGIGSSPPAPWPPAGWNSTVQGAFIADGRMRSPQDRWYPWSPPRNVSPEQGLEYWFTASGGPTAGVHDANNTNPNDTGWPGCSDPGQSNCVSWSDSTSVAGKNSIFAMTTEQKHSGSKSLKLGNADNYNKVTASMYVASSKFPSSGIMQLSFGIWFSNGLASTPNQKLVMNVAGAQIRLYLDSGVWQYADAGAAHFYTFGTLKPSTEAWHVITINGDLGSSTWDSVLVDGVSVSSSIKGIAWPKGTKVVAWDSVFAFSVFIDQSYQLNTSVYTAGAKASYLYLDDYEIEVAPATPSTSSTITTGISSSTSSSTSPTGSITTTMSTTTAEFPSRHITAVLATILVVALAYRWSSGRLRSSRRSVG